MSRLPNVTQVIEQAKKIAGEKSTTTKVATEGPLTFSVPVARGLQYLAESLKTASPDDISFEEVLEYGRSLLKE